MSADCCFAAFEPNEPALDERTRLHPADVCHGRLFDEEPCLMATGANCDDKMAADETTLALEYIRDMCLDRPCPGCKSEVIEKPHDDLRQCRACGHVWGFDDTQNLEGFVRDYGRMQACIVCDNDSLDKFEVVENLGRQELICLNCQSVQGRERLVPDRNIRDYDVITMDQEGYEDLEPDFPEPNPPHARDLACPFCPEMTYDFFEKEFDHDELVRVVCPGCSYVVFFKEPDNGIDDGRRARGNDVIYGRVHEDDRRAREDGVNDRRRRPEEADDKDKIQLFPPVKKALRYLTVKPIDLARHTLQECAESVVEGERAGARLRTMISEQAPFMGEQLGWTIGTAVGNIVFKNPAGASFTGTVGSIIGRGVCDMVVRAVSHKGRKV